jgi:hypothetical protein
MVEIKNWTHSEPPAEEQKTPVHPGIEIMKKGKIFVTRKEVESHRAKLVTYEKLCNQKWLKEGVDIEKQAIAMEYIDAQPKFKIYMDLKDNDNLEANEPTKVAKGAYDAVKTKNDLKDSYIKRANKIQEAARNSHRAMQDFLSWEKTWEAVKKAQGKVGPERSDDISEFTMLLTGLTTLGHGITIATLNFFD